MTARDAAIGAALAEHERDQLGTRSRRRRAELDTRILELRQQEAEAQSAADAVADEAKALVRVPKDQAERAQLAERIATAETRHNELRQTAAAKDQEAARRGALGAAATPDRSMIERLYGELRARGKLSSQRRLQESLERGSEVPSGARSAQLDTMREMEHQAPSVEAGPPLELPALAPPSIEASI